MTGRTIPRNLTLTTASLKDEPYESQVRVLRWIRALLSEVADKASSQAQSSSRRGDSRGEHHDQDEREAEDPQHEEKKSGSAKTSIASACTVVKELESADVLISVMEPKKDEDGVTEMFGATNDIQKTTSSSLAPVQRAESSSDHACEDEKPGGQQDVAVKGNGRKRGRELTPRSPNLLTVGRVVECFHPVSPMTACGSPRPHLYPKHDISIESLRATQRAEVCGKHLHFEHRCCLRPF